MKKMDLILLLLALMISAIGYSQKPPETEDEHKKAYERRIRQSELNGVYIPKDLPEALIQLNKLVDAESKAKFKSMPEEEASRKLFFSFGRWITHNWGFYGGSRLSHHFSKFGISYPDDMAHLIILSFHRSLHRKPIKFKEEAEKIRTLREQEYLDRLKKSEVLETFTIKRDSLKQKDPANK